MRVRGPPQVIPENMFGVLNEIVQLQTHELAELPVKVPRAELRNWAQLEPRHKLARATHRVSVLTEGVLNMQKTLLGVVQVDPKELLQDGIKRELVRQLSLVLQGGLVLKAGGRAGELEGLLLPLANRLEVRARALSRAGPARPLATRPAPTRARDARRASSARSSTSRTT